MTQLSSPDGITWDSVAWSPIAEEFIFFTETGVISESDFIMKKHPFLTKPQARFIWKARHSIHGATPDEAECALVEMAREGLL